MSYNNTVVLTNEARIAMSECVVTRGAKKGLLKATAPPSRTMAYAAWQGLMMVFNPYKVSISGMMFMSEEQRVIMRNCEAWAEEHKHLRFADRDRAALETMGVW